MIKLIRFFAFATSVVDYGHIAFAVFLFLKLCEAYEIGGHSTYIKKKFPSANCL